ncbi:tRNA (cytidine32/uridine32-2'-O)-methyltransferase [Tahibacter aquaticus]|uniref:tRNA (cytidine/uridine-2'-O-)-methyltransferase TrmJ n=1 Tax=Tahibacter aquaticus TaxID=520092 RepID=A0A4R6Z9C9_9GAMM|nr:RNA methyltransferase [Tahibacter aquaticus]TDR48503.1 tRNA (cytidine32/uridine32-2'-O)-methyltransferase [Tahibacter aquaticus]
MSDISAVATRIRFVLVRTSQPGNIGAAARAIRTMGFARLVLVAPQRYPDAEATAFAAGADAVLDDAVVVPDLKRAIADCHAVYGATARQRNVALTEYTPREIAPRVQADALAGAEVALVFGNERTGLENDELALCHGAVHIPTAADYSSLNLAQAVQVLAYELRIRLLDNPAAPPPHRTDPPASAGAMEGFFEHLYTTLNDIEFHKGRSPETIMLRLRKLFLRAAPDERELRVLRGILADAQRMARLARGGS